MTKREAIRECKKLWKEIEGSGLSKVDFFDTPAGEKWRAKNYRYACPLCEDNRGYSIFLVCPSCPLVKQYGETCIDLGFRSDKASSPSFFKSIRGLK